VRQTVQNFRNLEVWNKAHELTFQVYRITEGFPRTEIFGLTSQLRRAAASIAANLAEGCGRTQLEFAKFIQIAFGSASESEYHLLLARDLGFVNPEDYERLTTQVVETKRMLSSLLKKIQLAAKAKPPINAAPRLPKQLT
jgi:four helix bundle protein